MTPPKPGELPIAVGLGRVSLEIQVGGFSPAAQDDANQLLASQFGYAMPEEYVLSDDGFQGDDFERPGLEEAFERIRTGPARAVVFPTADRMAREVEGGLRTVRQFHELGATVIIGDIGMLTPGMDDLSMRMMLNIKLGFAENEKAMIRSRVRKAMARMRREGKMCGRPSFGYRNSTPGQPGSWEANPAQVKVLLDIFQRIATGGEKGSLRAVVAHLVATKAAGRKWNVGAIKFIVNNACYLGITIRGRFDLVKPKEKDRRKAGTALHNKRTHRIETPRERWTEIVVPQLVPTELWEAANLSLARRKEIAKGRPSTNYPLRGLLYCGVCQKRGRGYPDNKGRKRYRCSCKSGLDQYGLAVYCANPSMPGPELEATVWDAIVDTFTDLPRLEKRLRSLPQMQGPSDGGKMRERVAALKRREQAARAKALEHMDEADTAAFYEDQIKRFAGERRALEKQMGTTTMPTGRSEYLWELWRPLAEHVSRETLTVQERRAILERLVGRVEFKNGDEVTVEFRIPIKVKAVGSDGGGTNCLTGPGALNNFTPYVTHRKLRERVA